MQVGKGTCRLPAEGDQEQDRREDKEFAEGAMVR